MTARKRDIAELPDWPRLMPQAMAAAYCGVSKSHFLATVRIQPVLIGTKKLWDRTVLDKWIDSLTDNKKAKRDPDYWRERVRTHGHNEDSRHQ